MSSDSHGHAHVHGHAHGHGSHGHAHGHARDTPRRALSVAVMLTAGFMVVEVVVGVMSGSLALLADAGHMLADTGALSLALVAQVVASQPRTHKGTYGYRRAEVLAAFVNGIALAVVAVFVLKEAVERWFAPVEIRGLLMLQTAVLGLVVNGVVAAILARGRAGNINLRAAFAHVVFDALGSAAAILAGVLVLAFNWVQADALLSMGIALLVAVSGYRILKETTDVLLETAPKNLRVPEIERTIASCPGVAEVHDLHVWRISEGFDTLTAHVMLERNYHGTDVCRSVAERLRLEHGLTHVTIQPEACPPQTVVPLRRGRSGKPVCPPDAEQQG